MSSIKEGCYKPRLYVSVNLLAAILNDPIVAVVTVCTRPQTLTLVTIAMRKSIHEFPLLSYMGMGLHLAALWAAGAPLKYGYYRYSSILYHSKIHKQ